MKKTKTTAVLVAVCMLLTSIVGTFTVNAKVTPRQLQALLHLTILSRNISN